MFRLLILVEAQKEKAKDILYSLHKYVTAGVHTVWYVTSSWLQFPLIEELRRLPLSFHLMPVPPEMPLASDVYFTHVLALSYPLVRPVDFTVPLRILSEDLRVAGFVLRGTPVSVEVTLTQAKVHNNYWISETLPDHTEGAILVRRRCKAEGTLWVGYIQSLI